jgi:hypothetical protein
VSAVQLVLSFENGRWRARGGGIDVAHAELRGLEALVEAELAAESPVDVELAFDMAALPRWLEQYHAHYCNYTLRVPGRSARA